MPGDRYPDLMSHGSHPSLDAQIRCELAAVGQPTGSWGDEVAGPGVQARLAHALRAVLDECAVLDSDPETAQLGEDIRAVIATALRIDD
jgi:hypothetical protein